MMNHTTFTDHQEEGGSKEGGSTKTFTVKEKPFRVTVRGEGWGYPKTVELLPCDRYRSAEPDGYCEYCGYSPHAH